MATQPVSDLAQLWQAAVEDYEKTTGKSLRLGQFGSMEEVIGGTESLSNKFKGFRDDKSKVSKVRTAFKNNMWLIQTIVNTIQTVGNAASVSLERPSNIGSTKTVLGFSPCHAGKSDILGLWAGHAGTQS